MKAWRMRVVVWTDWFNLLERRGKWEHWMNSAGLEQERYGYGVNTVPGEKWDGRFNEMRKIFLRKLAYQ